MRKNVEIISAIWFSSPEEGKEREVGRLAGGVRQMTGEQGGGMGKKW